MTTDAGPTSPAARAPATRRRSPRSSASAPRRRSPHHREGERGWESKRR